MFKLVVFILFEFISSAFCGDYRVTGVHNGIYTVQYSSQDFDYGPTLAPTMIANPGDKVIFTTPACRIRAPIAAAIMSVLLHSINMTNRFKIDTAALYASQVGKGPDPRTLKVLRSHKIILKDHKVRYLRTHDFRQFHGIYAFDHKFKKDYDKRQPKAFFSAFAPFAIFDGNSRNTLEIPDPYYHDAQGFELCFQSILRASVFYLDSLFKAEGDFLGVMPQYLIPTTLDPIDYPRVEDDEIIQYNISEQHRHHNIELRQINKWLKKKKDPFNWSPFY